MIKQLHSLKSKANLNQKEKPSSNMSIFSFFKKATESIVQKSEAALTKIHGKLIEDNMAFAISLQKRKNLMSKDKSVQKDNVLFKSKPKFSESQKSNGQLSEKDNSRLHELMKKKFELMARLRKIDQELHTPGLLPITIESNNNSFFQGELEKNHGSQGAESRINLKQSNTYNLVQHQKTVEMLTRINHEKLRRQEKIVSDMRKKQETELRKLEELQKNRSRLQLSRHQRVLPAIRAINKAQTEKLQQNDEQSSSRHFNSFQKQKDVENEFDEIEDIPIGPSQRMPTEVNENSALQEEKQ